MTTENERVAGYIIPELYDRFDQFCKENNLNCSRALNVIIAEYFGLEETLLYRQTWIGGVTLDKFENLKKEVEELKELVNTLSNASSITPKKQQQKSSETISKNRENDLQTINLSTTELTESTTELAKRFNVSRGLINNQKRKLRENKITKEEYIEWTKSKDPENKGWFFDENTNFVL
jgi:hypothetical protein